MRGAWIEIGAGAGMSSAGAGRSPCGERGLKSFSWPFSAFRDVSLPVRGAWIEIKTANRIMRYRRSRSPCGERGLKSVISGREKRSMIVAPRAGSVD